MHTDPPSHVEGLEALVERIAGFGSNKLWQRRIVEYHERSLPLTA
jgi:hypothetical protein